MRENNFMGKKFLNATKGKQEGQDTTDRTGINTHCSIGKGWTRRTVPYELSVCYDRNVSSHKTTMCLLILG